MSSADRIRAAAEDLHAALAGYDPESMRQVVRELPILGEALADVSAGLRAVADRAETEWPTGPAVTEGLRSMANDVRNAADTAGVAQHSAHTHHQADIERHDAPRGGRAAESRWDVARADHGTPPAAPAPTGGRHRAPEQGEDKPTVTATPPTGPGPGKEGVPDPLRVASRIVLREGERFAGSGSVAGSDGQLALGAAVDTPQGRQVHLGLPIDPEDKKNWRGGNAPNEEERPVEDDEADGETYTIETGADDTVVLDAADAARLAGEIEGIIERATAADKEYRQLVKNSNRLYDQRTKLEERRFPGRGEEKIALDNRVEHDEKYQGRRRRDVERAVDRLSPADRAAYDERQRKIDAAGRDAWEPGKEAEAAEVCGLTGDEFKEMRDLERIPYQQRTAAQEQRLDQLAHGGGDCLHPVLPPLLAEQAALVCGLTLDEYREMEALDRIPARSRHEYHNRGRRVRMDAEQARLDELEASPRGATGANQRETDKLRGEYLSMLRTHHSSKSKLADARAEQAAMEATAQPLDAATAAELERVTANLDAVGQTLDERGGYASAGVEIPSRNGGALVVEAMQEEEEGGVRYRVERKPADADEDWYVGSNMDPYTATPGGLRKLGKLARDLAGAGEA
jgi:hypothetical protein